MKRVKPPTRFARCVRTQGSEDLEARKLYQVLPDLVADREGYVRIVDESGEDSVPGRLLRSGQAAGGGRAQPRKREWQRTR